MHLPAFTEAEEEKGEEEEEEEEEDEVEEVAADATSTEGRQTDRHARRSKAGGSAEVVVDPSTGITRNE